MRAGAKRRRAARRRGEQAVAGGPAGPGGTLTSFAAGFETLVSGLARAVGAGHLRTDAGVRRLAPHPGGWRLELTGGDVVTARTVVLASPAWFAADVVRELDAALASDLAGIPGAPLAVVATAWRTADLPRPPDGFGYLVPRGEGLRSLGTLWDSSIFPGRAPAGFHLLRTMIGGAHDPDAVRLDDDELVAVARRDLARTMAVQAPPRRTWVFRHPRGIPQYVRGHAARLSAIEARLAAHPGLFVTGNAYRGVSVNLCVLDAARTADRVIAAVGAGAA